MIGMIPKILRYANILLAVFIAYNTISFINFYFFDSTKSNALEKLEKTKQEHINKVKSIKDLIEKRDKINQEVIDQSFIDDKEIDISIKEVVGEITDRELGILKIQDTRHTKSKDYINLYITELDILYVKNALFPFEELIQNIEKELLKKIKIVNDMNENNFEIILGSFIFDDKTSTLKLIFNLRKNITRNQNEI